MAYGEERYQEWLDRLEIPIEQQANIAMFQEYLREEFNYGDEQVDALTSAHILELDFESVGIHAVTVTYAWGKDLRYGITGEPGLWGFASAQRFYNERIEETE